MGGFETNFHEHFRDFGADLGGIGGGASEKHYFTQKKTILQYKTRFYIKIDLFVKKL